MPRKAKNPAANLDSRPSERITTQPPPTNSLRIEDQPVNKPRQNKNAARNGKERKPLTKASLAKLGIKPTTFNVLTGDAICVLIVEGRSLNQAIADLGLNRRTVFGWMCKEPQFREDLFRAREVRADMTFGESIIDIADASENDWGVAQNGRPIVNKEIVLRSKIRIEARQFHMSRLHHTVWGDKQTVDIKNDWNLLSEDERRRRAEELIVMIQEVKNPPQGPPPLVYRPEPPPDDDTPPGGIG